MLRECSFTLRSRLFRRGPGSIYRSLKSIEYLATRDRHAVISFLRAPYVGLTIKERIDLLSRFVNITNQVRAYHTQAEILTVADRILRLAGRRELTVVEAGAGKGSSTAKLSLVARAAGARLLVFDSFRGLPENDEVHRNLDGRVVRFRAGAFTGRLAQVERTVRELGAIEVCEFVKGWFEETMPKLDRAIDVALLDVDLLSSTRTCLVHLAPRLREGGSIFSQDGHLEAIVALLRDEKFWRDEVGIDPPCIDGLGKEKLLEIRRS
jgi:O-methyltransferase